MATRDVVYPANPHALYDMHGYSPAVKSNGFLFVAGQVGAQKNGEPVADIAQQTQLAFDNLREVLKAAGASFDDIIDVTLFIVDPQTNFEKIFPVLQQNWTPKPFPTVTAVGATWLAGFTFEIKVIAKLPA
jgi:enamine deaminase RidA (YjgF/YER057c/UK114 family)